MAKSAAEYQRAYRERKKAKLKVATDETPLAAAEPFFEFFDRHGDSTSFQEALDHAGIEPPIFEDDSDPVSYSGEIGRGDPEFDPYGGATGSLGRAEIMVGGLISAAIELASIINAYKVEAIEREEERLHSLADQSTPDRRRAILEELVRLNRMRDHLDKQVRWQIPQWEVKGV